MTGNPKAAEARRAEIAERVGDMPLIASALRRQIQIDEHGENCGVSRQACDHAAEIIDGVPDILAELSRLTAEVAAREEAIEAEAKMIANSLATKEDWSIGSMMWNAARLGAFIALASRPTTGDSDDQ